MSMIDVHAGRNCTFPDAARFGAVDDQSRSRRLPARPGEETLSSKVSGSTKRRRRLCGISSGQLSSGQVIAGRSTWARLLASTIYPDADANGPPPLPGPGDAETRRSTAVRPLRLLHRLECDPRLPPGALRRAGDHGEEARRLETGAEERISHGFRRRARSQSRPR